MYEPQFDYDPDFDYRPYWGWLIAVVILLSLPSLGIECLFGWCVVQSDNWTVYAFGMALAALFVLSAVFWVVRKLRNE